MIIVRVSNQQFWQYNFYHFDDKWSIESNVIYGTVMLHYWLYMWLSF